MDPKELGKKGEAIAMKRLLKAGYKIHQQNYVYLKAEIDIVAEQNHRIVFVEVKTRQSAYLSDPALLVPISKQKQIIRAADQYMKDHFPERESRFDIMVVITNSGYTSVEHIVDAFYPMV